MNNIIHIIRHTARAATVLLLALLTTAQGAWAWTGSGTSDATLLSTRQPVTVAYIDEYGTTGEASAIALDGTETTLAAGWYFVGKDIDYPTTATVTLDGDVNLILADDKTMNIRTTKKGDGIFADGHSLHIYGQTEGTGALNAQTNDKFAVVIRITNGTLGIHGGNVNANVESTVSVRSAIRVVRATAGTPFIIKWDESGTDITNPVFEDVTIDATNRDATVADVLTFTGTYAPVSIPAAGDNTKLYLGAANKLYYPTKAMTIGTHRAYFQLSDGITAGESTSPQSSHVRAFNLNFFDEQSDGAERGDDEATGIISVHDSGFMVNGSDAWYTLDGRRLDKQPTAKDLYIHGGRKVIVK